MSQYKMDLQQKSGQIVAKYVQKHASKVILEVGELLSPGDDGYEPIPEEEK